MEKRNPEGYRKLLAYKKSCGLQVFTNEFVVNLPKTKTFFDLADQMGRSGRSGSKNIVEGWKRNTTKEYFDFLGFSIGAVEELKDDAADIATGVYPNLMGLRGKMGEKGIAYSPHSPLTLSTLLVPLNPASRDELDRLRFYPIDQNLPAVIRLFLCVKEVNYLLHCLQQSLDIKMNIEYTKPVSQRVRENWSKEKQNDDEFLKYMESIGLRRLENGRVVSLNDPD